RSDERIMEDACDALTQDWGVDARQISVTVSNGEETLDGTVPSRQQKRRAEDCVDDLSGVTHVQNNLRVQQPQSWDRNSRSDDRGREPGSGSIRECSLVKGVAAAAPLTSQGLRAGRACATAPRPMDAFLSSTILVALAEMGDKTQLLALVLAARFRRPMPIVWGILLATLANHALAAWLGVAAAAWLATEWFGIAVAIAFIAMGLWTFVPDKLDENE